jgi:uncharacterized membrane protein SpoIIM required for sporulation
MLFLCAKNVISSCFLFHSEPCENRAQSSDYYDNTIIFQMLVMFSAWFVSGMMRDTRLSYSISTVIYKIKPQHKNKIKLKMRNKYWKCLQFNSAS